MSPKTLRWVVPSLIMVTALTLPLLVNWMLDSDPIEAFLIGMGFGYPGGSLAVLAFAHYNDKVNPW